MNTVVDRLRRHSTAVSVVVLALLAYLPALASSPGRMPADSKLYVYLDPGRFVADTTTTFDPRQFAGWVPHQHIAYLWPTGPWYWVFDQLGVPDWIAHRLWIGTLLVAAGLGVRWMIRVLGFPPLAALTAAIVYQFSPYVLPYLSRTSVLLLPFAGLGWIVGCTVLAGRRGGWRHPALIALIVLTVGAVNATALAMIIPAPVLWLVHAVWERSISWRRALLVGAKVALLATGVSLWWIAMLVIQGRDGADVLAYSESLESVSFTSTSTEVGRGLGYWLFYIRDAFTATTSASLDHLVSGRTVLLGFAVSAVCLAGVVFVRSPHRRFAGLLVGAGVILGVGVHPIDDPSPFMDLLVGDGEGGLALALRSSTRAVPVLLVGLSIGAASLVSVSGEAVRRRAPGSAAGVRVAVAALVALIAVAALPSARQRAYVDPAIDRDEQPPTHWTEAAAALDALPDGYRVLQVPGTEFGAFEWGYTVDQPLPGLTERPLVTRDLLPLGSPSAMELVFALDDRFQSGTFDVASLAPVARLLGVDTVWVAGDVTFERFRSARPEVTTDQLTGPQARSSGLGSSTPFGPEVSTEPEVAVLDAESLADPRVGRPVAPITLVDVDDAIPTVRVKDETVVVVGSADGLVDAAAAGLIDGSEAVRYAASARTDPVDTPVDRIVVTDSNRRRAHHWRSSQDVHGYTEEADGGVLRTEPADQRLPVFGDGPSDPDTQTVSIQRGPVTARASAYGEPFAYRPEDRAVMAIDGDPSTAWRVADRSVAVGEYLDLRIDESVVDDVEFVEVLQPATLPGQRSISSVAVSVDGVSTGPVELGPESFVDSGQRIDVGELLAGAGDSGAAAGSERPDGPVVVRIEIVGTTSPQPPIADAIGAVGLAEVGLGLAPTVEWIRTPIVDADPAGPRVDVASTPIDVVVTRLRVESTDRWRADPEPVLRREVELPRAVTARPEVTLRLDRRLDGDVLASLLDEPVVDGRRLTGSLPSRGAAAFDGDPSSAWTTPFVDVVGSTVRFSGEGSASSLAIDQSVDDRHSPITEVRVDDGGEPFTLPVPAGPSSGDLVLPREISLDDVTLTITAVDARTTLDRRYAEPFVLPAAVSEIRFDGVAPAVRPVERLTADCRDDLLTIDGEGVPLSFDVDAATALSGEPIDAEVCTETVDLAAGTTRIEGAPGRVTGIDVDRVTLVDIRTDGDEGRVAGGSTVDSTSTVLVDSSTRSRTIDVPACPDGCWVVVGEGFNTAWAASVDGEDLGEPVLVDGNANGWWLPASATPATVEVPWTAQGTLHVAFALSALTALVCLVLVARDRRREDDGGRPLPDLAGPTISASPRDRAVLVTGLVGVVGAALFVGWTWALLAALVWAVGIVVGRPQVVAWVGWVVIVAGGLIVTQVVRTEEPFPNAGWPVRFEYLHGWTLLGFVLVTAGTLLPHRPDHRPPVVDHVGPVGARPVEPWDDDLLPADA